MLVSLCLTTIAEGYKQTVSLTDFLTNKNIEAQIYTYESVTAEKLIGSVNKQNLNDYLIYKDFYTGSISGKAVYFKGSSNFNPDILSGRNFNENDFIEKTNTILIEESLKDKCIKKDNKQYFSYSNKQYEVIGIYKNTEKLINKDSMFYINLAGYSKDSTIAGNYFFDQIDLNNLQAILSDVNNISYQVQEYKPSFSSSVNIILNNSGIVIAILGITIILIILNIFGATYAWILNKYREISIRRLVGATDESIWSYVMFNYFILIVVSFIIGSLLSFAALKTNLIAFLPKDINIWGMVLSFAFCLILGFSTLSICLRNITQKEISGKLR